MNTVFAVSALKALDAIAAFVESKNTPGSGNRYIQKFTDHIEQFAQPNVHYVLCTSKTLSRLKYSCINYNGWVVAFKIEGDLFKVYRIIHGALLKE